MNGRSISPATVKTSSDSSDGNYHNELSLHDEKTGGILILDASDSTTDAVSNKMWYVRTFERDVLYVTKNVGIAGSENGCSTKVMMTGGVLSMIFGRASYLVNYSL